MASDTLSISKDLRAAGFSEEQADALATRPGDLVTKQDLALAAAELERKIDHVDQRVDAIARELLLKLGAGMVAGFGLTITVIGIGVGVLLSQPG